MSGEQYKADLNLLDFHSERDGESGSLELPPDLATRLIRLDSILLSLVSFASHRSFDERKKWTTALEKADEEFGKINRWFGPIRNAARISSDEERKKVIESFHKDLAVRYVLMLKLKKVELFHH